MTIASVSVLGGLVLILSIRLIVHSRNRRKAQPVTIDDYTKACEALDSVFTETETIKRIFSVEDTEFIERFSVGGVKQLFFYERKKLALRWIRNTRKHVGCFMNLHLQLTSHTYDPHAGFEFMLAMNYFYFMVISNIALLLMWIFGPFRVRVAVSCSIRSATNLCHAFGLRLERVEPSRFRSGRESLVH